MAHAAPQEVSLTTKNTASLTMGIAAIVVGILASCATIPPIETPSGRPECSISGATNDEVQSYLLERFMSDGWMLKQQSPSQLVLWKENASTFQNVLLGSQYDPTTTHEVRFIFSGQGTEVRIFGQVAIVTNEGSAFEQRNDLTGGKAGHELWQSLVRVEEHFEQRTVTASAGS